MADPGTTSYAILALLAIRPWTTYDLARQMERSLRDVWPRAESVVYEEPKRLVALGLAKAEKRYTGRRAATVYTITLAGRRALRAWLASEPAGRPVFEYEAMLKIAFGDLGSREGMLRSIRCVRDDAAERVRYVKDRLREYEETGGPFPERLPVQRLVGRFMLEQAETMHRWAVWAEREVGKWGASAAEPRRRKPS